jgi:hypothetical protein
MVELDARGVDLGADEEDPLVHAGTHPGVCHGEPVEEAAALVPHVERGDAGQAELVAEEAARAGEVVVRRERREDDRVDVLLAREAGVLERHLRRLEGEIAGADAAVLDEAPLLDPRALGDPLV